MVCIISSVLIISIHAPANGATLVKELGQWDYEDFNPRSGERSDHRL